MDTHTSAARRETQNGTVGYKEQNRPYKTTGRCKNCAKYRGSRPRGLCKACYTNLDIRARFDPVSKYGNRGLGIAGDRLAAITAKPSLDKGEYGIEPPKPADVCSSGDSSERDVATVQAEGEDTPEAKLARDIEARRAFSQPTDTLPYTEDRLQVLSERARLGLPLQVVGDRGLGDISKTEAMAVRAVGRL